MKLETAHARVCGASLRTRELPNPVRALSHNCGAAKYLNAHIIDLDAANPVHPLSNTSARTLVRSLARPSNPVLRHSGVMIHSIAARLADDEHARYLERQLLARRIGMTIGTVFGRIAGEASSANLKV